MLLATLYFRGEHFTEFVKNPWGKVRLFWDLGKSSLKLNLRVCCRDLTEEVLNTGRENFSEGKLIYFIQTEGKGKGEDDLCLA